MSEPGTASGTSAEGEPTMTTNGGPDRTMGIDIKTEQKVCYFSQELADERIREIQRAVAHRHRWEKARRERTRQLWRLLLILR